MTQKKEPDTPAKGPVNNTEQSNLTLITFVAPHGMYSRGDTAGFSTEEAEGLLKRKLAVKGAKLPQPDEGG